VEKSYHHGDLKAALMKEALAMIAAHEDHLIGFRELARRLEVSRTAPYRHFPSVEHLLAALIEQGYHAFLQNLDGVLEHPEYDPRTRFLELGITYINFALEHPAHYRLMFDQRFFTSGSYPEIKKLSRKAFHSLKRTIEATLPEDTAEPELKQLAQLAWACVHGMARLFIDGQWQGLRNRQEFIRQSCQRLLTMV
jgi:AcrR family transcriptional regulator